MLQPRYMGQMAKTVNYITEKIANGYMLECQMYWTSAILRNMNHPDIQHLMKLGIQTYRVVGLNAKLVLILLLKDFPLSYCSPQISAKERMYHPVNP